MKDPGDFIINEADSAIIVIKQAIIEYYCYCFLNCYFQINHLLYFVYLTIDQMTYSNLKINWFRNFTINFVVNFARDSENFLVNLVNDFIKNFKKISEFYHLGSLSLDFIPVNFIDFEINLKNFIMSSVPIKKNFPSFPYLILFFIIKKN